MATRAEVASRVNRNRASGNIVTAHYCKQAYNARGQEITVNRAAIGDGAGQGEFADAVVAGCACKAVVACIRTGDGAY